MPSIQLRDYQQAAVDEVRSEFRAKNYPTLFVLPTGGGKTYTFSYIAENAAAKGNPVVIIVHRKELLLQASASLRNLGIEHGLISPFFTPEPNKRIQVASIDTLLIRLKKGPMRFGLIIFDEAHHVIADNKWGRVFEALGRPPMLGVTATPVRTDGKGLGEHAGGVFKTMVLGPSTPELIERGMLINPVVYSSIETPDLSGIGKNKDGDYNRTELAARVDKPKITGNAVAHYSKICPGARAIVFCSSIEHARHVAAEFNAAGYRFELLVGAPEMSDAERTAVNKKLRRGEIDGACTVDLVSEGYDLPDLVCCIMLRPTASEALFLQQVGRVMRPSEGKTTCYLLDHVGNVGATLDGQWKRKHGMPNEERDWTLDGRKKRKGKQKDDDEPTIAIKQCPQCYHVHEPAPSCPTCGFIYPQPGGRSLEQVEGELQRITPEMEAQIKSRQRADQGRAQSVEEMVEKLGYSRSRAQNIVRAREEKAAFREALRADIDEWRKRTGQTVLGVFGKPFAAINGMKPKELREWRAKLDEMNPPAAEVSASEDEAFKQFMRRAVKTSVEEQPALI
ncbi:type III restriction enzyme, res subunit [Caballeronia pedi]|uniref:Type III restriction enzyme, res subunit n=1 Tax=Caballeronia pedi TaxID=1777141 RepID=A0A158DXS0_9BURK|nr:DEAD/DEAH box helicase [Caballeronia pedi]SAK98517.1 type III restriction enzyme, res subunit [Caballeronia pedi]